MLTLGNAVLKIPQLISTARRPYILEISGKSALAHDYSLGSQPTRQFSLGRYLLRSN